MSIESKVSGSVGAVQTKCESTDWTFEGKGVFKGIDRERARWRGKGVVGKG